MLFATDFVLKAEVQITVDMNSLVKVLKVETEKKCNRKSGYLDLNWFYRVYAIKLTFEKAEN